MAQIDNFVQAPYVMINRIKERKLEKPSHSDLNGAPLGDGCVIPVFQQKISLLHNLTLI
jgi:hypothetical protein